MTRKHVIIGERYRAKLGSALEDAELTPIYLPDNPFVAPALAGHADLSVFSTGRKLILAPYLRNSRAAAELAALDRELCFADILQGAEYPADCGINACAVGEKLLCRENVTAAEILACFQAKNRINIRQGYARCSICVVNDKAIITADFGAASAAERAGLEALRVAPGFFDLPGYEYGFIGGASFKLSPDKLVFTGDISAHPDAEKIVRFVRAHGVEPVYITRDKPIDIGGAVVL